MHPKHHEILQLIEDGHSDREIQRRTGADRRPIARIRATDGGGIRGKQARKPNPQEQEILRRLKSGQRVTDIAAQLEVRPSSVTHIRRLYGVRAASRKQPQTAHGSAHRRRALQVKDLLRQNLTDEEIAARVGLAVSTVRNHRRKTRFPGPPADAAPSLEEKWNQLVRLAQGGHMEWTGYRRTRYGTPMLKHEGRYFSAASVAFRLRTGREPVGRVRSDCGITHCVAPGHVMDHEERKQLRAQLLMLRPR